MNTLPGLLEKAIAARDMSGPQAIAERLLLFSNVVDALEKFVYLSTNLDKGSREIKLLSRELHLCLTRIEKSYGPNGPDQTHVSAYYKALIRLRNAVKELEIASTVLTLRDLK